MTDRNIVHYTDFPAMKAGDHPGYYIDLLDTNYYDLTTNTYNNPTQSIFEWLKDNNVNYVTVGYAEYWIGNTADAMAFNLKFGGKITINDNDD